ncbi:hypothetical protein ACI2L1_24580 [Streptomyces sp. NPDC019531]|uniref:hypothetical protein n=1 Tax=Streptomyces sp. NPDC019531 TaxID=3365062 RepID=UPI00384AAF23
MPRNDEQRLLLKLVWQEAAKEGWPTFRMVDRSLYQRGIDVVKVLAQLPPHLLVGWPDSRDPVPSSDTLLKLTIAGVAHCPETADVIDTFVTLVRTLAHIEEHWPARSEQPVRLHSENAQAETGLLSRPELGELLRLGFVLSREEPWCVYSKSLASPVPLRTFVIPKDGPPEEATPTVRWEYNVGLFGWELGVDPRIRIYRSLEDIGDYWGRRSRQLANPSLRGNRTTRFEYLVGELVDAAAEDPTDTVRLDRFIGAAVSLGEHTTIDEVLRAAQYLHRHGLATFRIGTGHQPESLTLTLRGIDCVLSGKKVSQFVSEQPQAAGPVTNNFTQKNSAGAAGAQGVHVTQHVGVQPTQLAELIGQLREVAPQLELDVTQRDSFIEDVEILDDSNRDTQVRLSAGQRLKAALAEGGATVGAAGILAGLDRIVAMISG